MDAYQKAYSAAGGGWRRTDGSKRNHGGHSWRAVVHRNVRQRQKRELRESAEACAVLGSAVIS